MNSPIIKKDLKVISRSMKFSWGLFAYEAVLVLVFLITMSISSQLYSYMDMRTNAELYSNFVYFFPAVGIAQLCIIALIVPIITASSISGERERQTMDVLLTTTTSTTAIILGKIGSAVLRVMTFVFASIPMLSVAFIVGGMSWLALFAYIIMAFFLAVLTGSIGTLCSAICKKSITAIILSYVMYGVLYSGSFLIWLFEYLININRSDYYLAPITALFNPVFTWIAYFGQVLADEAIFEVFHSGSGSAFYAIFDNNYVVIILSLILQCAFTALFVWLAALKIKPGKK